MVTSPSDDEDGGERVQARIDGREVVRGHGFSCSRRWMSRDEAAEVSADAVVEAAHGALAVDEGELGGVGDRLARASDPRRGRV